ncbi:MAG: DNA repair protein RecN, partial [Clostridia bacterium]|nr:DNA repair protein RecN [Clostridia bacterium]
EDGNILITRRLSLSGKGLIKINGKPFTAASLRQVASGLINIHGQHDSQALLDPEKHCGFIDSVAENEALKEDYYAEFKSLNKIRKELAALEMDEDEKERKTELLKYQINELSTADIKLGEIAELKEKLELAENFEKNLKAFSATSQILSGDDDTGGVITNLKIASRFLGALDNETCKKSFSDINELISKAEDILAEVKNQAENLAENYKNPDEINARLDFLYRLMLKYGNSEEKMLEFLESAQQELETITFSDKRADELADELEKAKERLVLKGEALTNSRNKASKIFTRDVCDTLEYLNMAGVRLVTKIDKGRYSSNGCDNVEFLISANRGEELKPLSKIASGGELSRIMLAIKSALVDKDNIPTMIFDEIDAGISGFAADKVATKLKEVAKKRQVICITHLAQIAVKADNHLLIEKSVSDDRTKTTVTPITGEDRIKEIARIMSGKEITENIYNSAKELLDRSNI